MLLLLLSPILSFIIAAILTPLARTVAIRFNALDVPGGRRHHIQPTPRFGGLAIAAGFGLAAMTFWLADELAGQPSTIPAEIRTPHFGLTALAALCAIVVGIIDDVFELRARWQLMGLVAISTILFAAGIRLDAIRVPLSNEAIYFALPVAALMTTLWIVGVNVSLNFSDGLDGLAAGISVIAAITLGTLALGQEPFIAWMCFTLAGATVGFLIYNFHPAKIFLGTSGVTFIACTIAVLSILAREKAIAAVLVLAVPIGDTFIVIVRRIWRRSAPFAPDRGHFHHRLVDIGLSHTGAVVLIYGLTVVLAGIDLLTADITRIAAFVTCIAGLGVVTFGLSRYQRPFSDNRARHPNDESMPN